MEAELISSRTVLVTIILIDVGLDAVHVLPFPLLPIVHWAWAREATVIATTITVSTRPIHVGHLRADRTAGVMSVIGCSPSAGQEDWSCGWDSSARRSRHR